MNKLWICLKKPDIRIFLAKTKFTISDRKERYLPDNTLFIHNVMKKMVPIVFLVIFNQWKFSFQAWRVFLESRFFIKLNLSTPDVFNWRFFYFVIIWDHLSSTINNSLGTITWRHCLIIKILLENPEISWCIIYVQKIYSLYLVLISWI